MEAELMSPAPNMEDRKNITKNVCICYLMASA